MGLDLNLLYSYPYQKYVKVITKRHYEKPFTQTNENLLVALILTIYCSSLDYLSGFIWFVEFMNEWIYEILTTACVKLIEWKLTCTWYNNAFE